MGAMRVRAENELSKDFQVQTVKGGIYSVVRGVSLYDAENTRLHRASWEEEAFEADRRRFW